MARELKALVRATRDAGQTLSDLLPIYRRALGDPDCRVRAFAVDSVLLRASVAHGREWEAFAQELGPDDEYLSRVSWLGRSRKPVEGTLASAEAADRVRRRDTILWLIQHYPDSRVHQHIEASLNLPGDESDFDVAKSLWLKKVIEAPRNVDVLCNAASFLAVREPATSRGLILACIKVQPQEDRWRRLLAKWSHN